MSTARPAAGDAASAAEAVAAAFEDADFVRLVARANGDALAAGGLLAGALDAAGTPFQIRVSPAPDHVLAGMPDDGVSATIGAQSGDVAIPATGAPASVTAFLAARELGADPDPVLGLAGVAAADAEVEVDAAELHAAADERGLVTRRPGVAVPTTDLADGLAHSTLLHAPFSGDEDATRAAVESLSVPVEPADDADDQHTRVASMVAVETATADGADERAVASVERALRPDAVETGPFATVGGYGDVLDVVAREEPGLGVALALGGDVRSPVLEAWRRHARRAHGALQAATTGRYDGLFVARVDATDAPVLETVARLLLAFRSPEPVALVVADGRAAAASVEPRNLASVVASAASGGEHADGEVDAEDAPDSPRDLPAAYGTERRASARFDTEIKAFITAFREELQS